MFLLRRAIPFAAALAVFVSFFVFITARVSLIWQFIAVISVPVIFLFIVLWQLGKPLPRPERIHLILLIIFFVIGGFLFASFDPDAIWQYSLILIISVFTGFFSELIFKYGWNPAAYQPYSIEHFSRALQYGIIFLLSSFVFFIVAAGYSLILMSLIGAIIAALTGLSFFITQKIETKDYRSILVALSLIFVQVFAVVSFFPFDPKISASIITIAFYVFTGIVRQKFHRTESFSRVQGYVVIGIASIALIMLTARWR